MHEQLAESGHGEKYRLYPQLSQVVHATHFGTGYFRRGLGTKKELGEFYELSDWVLESVGFEEPRPHQYEFARLEIENAVLSKRSILPLVEAGVVSGWDDPRLSTLRGFRRRVPSCRPTVRTPLACDR